MKKRLLLAVSMLALLVSAAFSQPALDSTYVYKFDTEWINIQRVYYDYDDSQREIDRTFYQVEDAMAVEYLHYTTLYDAGGRSSGHTLYVWDLETSAWIGELYYMYEYGNTDQLVLFEGYTWDPETSSWVNDFRMMEAIDTNGDPVGGVYYYGSIPDAWIEFRKYSATYNANNQLIEEMHYYWDSISNWWIHDGLFTYEYDTDGNQTLFESSYRNPVTEEWSGNLRVVSLYDGENKIDGSYYHTDTLGNWVGYWRYTHAYIDTNLVEEIYYTGEAGTWTNNSRHVYTYENGARVEGLYYKWTGSDWVDSYREEHYWSDPNLIGRGYTDDILVYPNPITDYAIIKLDNPNQIIKVELIDISGRVIRSIDVDTNPVTLYLRDLPGGVYIIRIQADETYTKKVIIL